MNESKNNDINNGLKEVIIMTIQDNYILDTVYPKFCSSILEGPLK